MKQSVPLGWRAYGALVVALSWLHYAVLSRFGRSDEGGIAWFRQRRRPTLPHAAEGRRIWIHAVSAGESKVAELLRSRLLHRAPDLSVVLSATTYSGHARVRSIAGDDASFVMPLDTLKEQRRIISEMRPDMLVLVESEYWPAQFAAAAETGIPVLIVNATMSPRSFARHQRNPAIARRTIATATRIYTQDATIAARYTTLGTPPDRIEISGNLKLVPASRPEPAPKTPPVVVFGSIHRDEIEALAPAAIALRQARPDVRVVIVPRYPAKVPGEVLSAQFGAELRIVERLAEVEEVGPLVWLDEMGTLAELYRRATIAVVCGTFTNIGGHDLAEPLHAGAASVYGPDVSRQKPLHEALSALGCATQVAAPGDLATTLIQLLDNALERERMVGAFRAVSTAAEARLDGVVEDILVRLRAH